MLALEGEMRDDKTKAKKRNQGKICKENVTEILTKKTYAKKTQPKT